MKRWLSSAGTLVVILLLSACAQGGGGRAATPASSPSTEATPATTEMNIGFYGSASDSATGSTKLAYPTMHHEAGGTGTYNDPITFASDRDEFEPGTILYVPALRKYLIMEDDCSECDRSWEHGQRYEIQIWLGGAGSRKAAVRCGKMLSALVAPPNDVAQINPPTNALPVDPAALFDPTGNQCHTTVSVLASPLAADVASSLPTASPTLQVPEGFYVETVASVGFVREIVALPDGDLLAGTTSNEVMIVPNAESANVGAARPFLRLPDVHAEGVSYGPDGNIYIATFQHIWRVPYHPGIHVGSAPRIVADIRQGRPSLGGYGDPHYETSVLATARMLYFGVTASCDICEETDRTRATVQQMPIVHGTMGTKAKRIPDAYALAENPDTGSVWVAGGGQHGVGPEHPYEYADDLTAHQGVADYGWPVCGENQRLFNPLRELFQNCADTVIPLIIFPAHTTNIGMTFYPSKQTGAYVFPAHYLGGLFLASHGSPPSVMPQVEFVPMNGDQPVTPANWEHPSGQWETFMSDTRSGGGSSVTQELFTGIAVGPEGSLFVADDQRGLIYRIRP